ncbi:MAG TPA: glycosyl hydrolase [Thermoanaerobaculia bacterium]
MNARRRYQIAFFALGWLLALGVMFQGKVGATLRGGYTRAEASLARFGQGLSDGESRLREKAGGRVTRATELGRMLPGFSSLENLRQPDSMLLGAYDGGFPRTFAGLEQFETSVETRFPIVAFYQAWGDKPDQATFPLRMVETIDRLGSVPMITWEPWVSDFDQTRRTNLPPLAEREYASLAAIARGEYDFHIAPWAAAAAKHGKPILLRFAHEMNDPYRYPWGPQNGNRPDDFIAAWRHVHTVFQKMGATNVLWVWSPHISMPWFEFYYPGSEWVDWVSTGVLNYGDVASWSRWWSFRQILDKSYATLRDLQKPIMISEFGTLASGGDPAEWYARAFQEIRENYPAIRSVVFFHQKADSTIGTAPLDWNIVGDRRTVLAVREAIHSPWP